MEMAWVRQQLHKTPGVVPGQEVAHLLPPPYGVVVTAHVWCVGTGGEQEASLYGKTNHLFSKKVLEEGT